MLDGMIVRPALLAAWVLAGACQFDTAGAADSPAVVPPAPDAGGRGVEAFDAGSPDAPAALAPFGALCERADECATGLCEEQRGERTCAIACRDDRDCPGEVRCRRKQRLCEPPDR